MENSNQRVTNAKIFAKLEAMDARFAGMETRFKEWRDETRECNSDFETRIRSTEDQLVRVDTWRAGHGADHERISRDLGALRQNDDGSKRASAAMGAGAGAAVAAFMAVIKELFS